LKYVENLIVTAISFRVWANRFGPKMIYLKCLRGVEKYAAMKR